MRLVRFLVDSDPASELVDRVGGLGIVEPKLRNDLLAIFCKRVRDPRAMAAVATLRCVTVEEIHCSCG